MTQNGMNDKGFAARLSNTCDTMHCAQEPPGECKSRGGYKSQRRLMKGMVIELAHGNSVTVVAQMYDVSRIMQVPRDHQEITRLEGRYKSQGGLKEGMVIELANGESAMVVSMKDNVVAIDANNMMAGKTRSFEVTLQHIEPANR